MDFGTHGRSLASGTGTTMQLVDPADGFTPLFAVNDADKGWTLTTDEDTPGALPCILRVVGQDSKAYRRRKHELVDALRTRQKNLKAAQIEVEAMKLVSAGVIGWENIIWSDGENPAEPLPFTDENLLMFLDVYRPAFDQVNEFVAERANFLAQPVIERHSGSGKSAGSTRSGKR